MTVSEPFCARLGKAAEKLYGKETVLAITFPLTNNSTLFTCTSSLTAAITGTTAPSDTCTVEPLPPATADGGRLTVTFGATPFVSGER